MKDNWNKSLRLLLQHEGGFSNDSRDPGGITNLGVTKRQWEKYVGHAVSEDDMRELLPDRVAPFYKSIYWDAVHGDDTPSGIDHCMFDTAVNSGPGRAVILLQRILGVVVDGNLGPHTIDVAFKQSSQTDLIVHYCAARLAFDKSLPTWGIFGDGWEKRIKALQKEATDMVAGK